VVFFLAPPLLGFVAEHWGIRTAYLVCLPLIAASILASYSLSSKKPEAVMEGQCSPAE